MADARGPKFELGKETRKEILDALKNIKAQISQAKHRETTPTGVAADVLASGGGPFAAIKEALAFKASKSKAAFKQKYDPLNIIHRATGSKIATVLAGKLMRRSEESIRSAAGLQQKEQTIPSIAEPVRSTTENSNASSVSSLQPLLAVIAKNTTIIAKETTGIAKKIGASKTAISAGNGRFRDAVTGQFVSNQVMKQEQEQTNYLRDIWKSIDSLSQLTERNFDEEKDARAVSQAQRSTATQQSKPTDKEKKKDDNGGLLGSIGSWAKSLLGMLSKTLFSPLGLAFAGLVTAGVMLYRQWDNLKLSLSLLGDSIGNLWESIKTGLSSIKNWVSETLTSISDSILDIGESVSEKVKSFLPGYTAPSAEEKQKSLESRAAGTGPDAERAQRKLAKMNRDKVASTEEVSSAVQKHASTFSGKVSSSTTDKLKNGEYDTAAINSLLGKEPPTGTPEEKSTVGAITQLATKSYGEVYKDANGQPLRPSTDTPENREQRVPIMVRQASKALAETSTPISTPSIPEIKSPIPVAPTPPTTGQMLNDSAELKASASMSSPVTSINNVSPVNNVTNVNNNTIHQKMPNTRGGESSFMRSATRDYVPA